MLRRFALLACLTVAACGLPPNHALRDWARTAGIAVDRPSLAPAAAGDVLARQAALAGWLQALAILAEEEGMPAFGPAQGSAPTDPASTALAGVLRTAAATPPNRGPAVGADAQDEQRRLPVAIRAADPHVQALIAALSADMAGGEREEYRRALAAIGATHGMLAARARHLRQEDLARDLRQAEDGLRRIMLRLPPDPMVAARPRGATLLP
ncbi:hypothetical protein J5Y09_08985 [Roseomonas sp. PWR1]|uniref:Lipoprotein n=1 Tax=Roseomonas nitratireducens TaxID=2820810 RepID=A0ABS4ARS6_9PROT|nr:hypothetical protein [Neoroseomonas nitratireducens]MBP0464043.1 hypothetical protein [Neoroseomonas nitratireducens]